MWTPRPHCKILSSSFKLTEGRTLNRPILSTSPIDTHHRGRNKIVVPGHVNGEDVNVFVDTGSQVTLIDDSLIRRLGLQDEIRETDSRLSSFTKDAIPATGEITLELEVAGLATNHRCIVVKDLLDTEVLLGADFMTVHNISIELGKGLVTSRFGYAECIPAEKSIPKRTKIRASKSFVIPARTVMYITGSLEKKFSKNYTGLIEPYHNLLPDKGVLVANAMAHSLTRTVPVKLLNPTENDVVIYKRKLIGFLCPVDVADDNRHLSGLKVQRIAEQVETKPYTGTL